MPKKAVILTGGKQYLVQENQFVVVDYLQGEEKQPIKFDKVLMIDDGENLQLGSPYLDKAIVEAVITKQDKGKKIRVAKFKAKSKYRKVRGHRTLLTQVKILKIK